MNKSLEIKKYLLIMFTLGILLLTACTAKPGSIAGVHMVSCKWLRLRFNWSNG